MLFRVVIYITGFAFAVSGGIHIIAYLNLLTMGNSYSDFFLHIMKRPECYLFIVGISMITISVFGFDFSE